MAAKSIKGKKITPKKVVKKPIKKSTAGKFKPTKLKLREPVPSDIDIAQEAKLKPILQVAAELGIRENELELYGPYKAKVKLEILADLEDMKIYNTVGDLSTRTDVLKNRRDLLRAFFMASSEAIALGKRNRELTQKVITRQMKVTDRKRLDVIYDASLGRMPSKPYPREEAVQLELESIAFTDSLFKNKKASEFMDNSIIAELDRKGFFAKLQ